VPRSRVGDEHHFVVLRVGRAKQPFAGPVRRHLRFDHLRAADDEAFGKQRAVRLGDLAHAVEVARAPVVHTVPHLLGAQLCGLGVHASVLERGADRVAGQPDEVDAAVGARHDGARHGDRVDQTGGWHQRVHDAPDLGDRGAFCQLRARRPALYGVGRQASSAASIAVAAPFSA
jgi:hypothetical protein